MTHSQSGEGSATQADATLSIKSLRFEHLNETLGIGTATPRISWQIVTETPNWQQVAYELEAQNSDGSLHGSSGRIESSQSVLVAWPFQPLQSRERRAVRVRVWGNDGQVSNWSNYFWVEAGLLNSSDWQAQFITPDWEEDISQTQPNPMLRHEFELREGIVQARLYITALGVYEAHLNGQRVGDQIMAPGWTSYQHRLRYQTFDVTDQLQAGRNAIGAYLAEGWFRGRLAWNPLNRNIYGKETALLAQIEVVYADGSRQTIVSDSSWRANTGPLRFSSIYDGESYDARLERDGWTQAGYDDSDWKGVRPAEYSLEKLQAPDGPPVRAIETIAPVKIWQSPSGKTLVDFGQNLVGWVRIKVQGEAGRTITLRFAEVLEHEELGIRPLRSAKATDHYTLKGQGVEVWEPRFTFHGFRYAQVENWPGELQADQIEAVVCHSDMVRIGWLETSDSLLNRLHENVVWSMRGNFFDIPTDCPQRDERLGWTGDIQVFAPTASYLYDCAGFLESWLRDLAAEQSEHDGVVPIVIPQVLGNTFAATAWGDAAVIVPWTLYQRYGDIGILERQFESMRSWVDAVAKLAGDSLLWDTGFQFGDWLDPAAPPDNPAAARTNPHLVATGYFAHSATLVAKAAELLGRHEDAERYGCLAANVRRAFNREYVTPAGRLMSDAATGYAMALEFDLLAEPMQRERAAQRLAVLVHENAYHISTGFVGTPLICDALFNNGKKSHAFRLLTERSCPSWLYPVTMGATTIWERWDSMLPDGSINPGEMTSFNHYALGAVADWMQRNIGGIAPAEPGYRRIRVAPQIGAGLSWASARLNTPYGLVECSWKLENNSLSVTVIVPPNSSAIVTLPGDQHGSIEVGSGRYSWSYPYQSESNGPVTSESKLGDIVNDSAAWYALTQTVKRLNSDQYPMFERMLLGMSELTLAEAVKHMPIAADILPELEKAIDSR